MRFHVHHGQNIMGGQSSSKVDVSHVTRRGRAGASGESPAPGEEGYGKLPTDVSEEGATKALIEEVPANVSPQVAASKAISILMKMDGEGYCGVEKASVYGAAVALPQIARSAGWPGTLTALAFRSYLLLFLNIILQAFLLSMIGEEMGIMYTYSSQPHLCNFGADMTSCPGGKDCIGPGGTSLTPSRLYDFTTWNTRMYVQQSLEAVFPDKRADIQSKVDPGEYAIENYYCRIVCIFLFMMAVVDDLNSTFSLFTLLTKVPSQAESWVRYECPTWGTKDEVKSLHGWGELDLCKFQVAGMPRHWKVINFIIIVVPKCILWAALVLSGVVYLMETAGIINLIVNAMALAFILEVDEMVFNRLTSIATQHIMSNVEDMPLFSTEIEETETAAEALERLKNEEMGRAFYRKMPMAMSVRLIVIVVLQFVFMGIYYLKYCDQTEDGSWVSKPILEPETFSPPAWRLMFQWLQTKDTIFWKMPQLPAGY